MRLKIFKQDAIRLPRKKMQILFDAVIAEEVKTESDSIINLILTDDLDIQSLNKQFRGINRVTDVLSFNYDEPDNDNVLGEIYISVPAVKRQAKEYRVTISDELLRLTCHGLLHLFGYDHENHDDAVRMKAREEYFLNLV